MSDARLDDRATTASNQLDDVLALPDHLRDALWRVESARIEPFDAPGGLVVCGMGGSAIGGDLAAVAFGNRLSPPADHRARLRAARSRMLPDRAVLCSSYSGDTEETIACYEAAEALGARRIVATTGGALAEAARARRRAGDRPAGRAPAPRRGRLPVHGRRRGRGPRRRGAGHPHRDRQRRRRTWGRPRRPSWSAPASSPRSWTGSDPGDLRRRPDRARSPTAGRRQINENAKLPAFTASCPRPTTTRSSAGRARAEAGRLERDLPGGPRPAPAGPAAVRR